MSGKKPVRSSAQKITIGILVFLAGINAVWAVALEHSGPVIALLCYVLVAYLCWRRGHFQAGIIGGFFGLGIHFCELIFQGAGRLGRIELGFFYANTVLPIPLAYFSYKAQRQVKRGDKGT